MIAAAAGWYDPEMWIRLSERIGFPAAFAVGLLVVMVAFSLAGLKIIRSHTERLTTASEKLAENTIQVNTTNSQSLATVSTAMALSHEKLETIHDSVLAVHGDVHGVRDDVQAIKERLRIERPEKE